MKTISLWQPWASAVASGDKWIETRSWSTGYRGPLAIHAAKHPINVLVRQVTMHDDDARPRWVQFMRANGLVSETTICWDKLPMGAIVATCRLEDCVPVRDLHGEAIDLQHWCGDFSSGRYAWILRDIKPLATPFPCRGRQQLFDVEIPL